MIKISLKIILGIIILILTVVAAYLAFMTITDYKPEAVISLDIDNNKEKKVSVKDTMAVTTYNMGYAGMDKDVDFFMDGGTMSRSISKEKTLENLEGTLDIIKKEDPDFVFMQEVDRNSSRSYKIDQYEALKEEFKDYSLSFAINYKTPWVPVPLTNPHGKVLAGLVNMSKFNIESSTRYDLPGKEPWPVQLAELDRSISVSRFNTDNNKELVMINAHLSAYDKGGNIRKQQLGFLNDFLTKEYEKGNYVIIGGDWNHQIPGTDPTIFETTQEWPEWLQVIPDTFMPKGFSWQFDKNVPTARSVDKPYKNGDNFRAVIDGFMVSDNVQVIETKGRDLDFRYSDHNPVTLKFKLED
ncbi:endonuclease/exonuclease/phosphatase family protein [Clostridium sp.]|uniref:endonuclease/exonuclease/phosphatase family protein n=1 Tax=Clostridium sp. TaxID=1506 RepID=UPI0034647A1A